MPNQPKYPLVGYYIPPYVADGVRAMAEAAGIPASALVEGALWRMVKRYRAGRRTRTRMGARRRRIDRKVNRGA